MTDVIYTGSGEIKIAISGDPKTVEVNKLINTSNWLQSLPEKRWISLRTKATPSKTCWRSVNLRVVHKMAEEFDCKCVVCKQPMNSRNTAFVNEAGDLRCRMFAISQRKEWSRYQWSRRSERSSNVVVGVNMKDYSKIDFNEVFRLLGLMEECVTRVHALRISFESGCIEDERPDL